MHLRNTHTDATPVEIPLCEVAAAARAEEPQVAYERDVVRGQIIWVADGECERVYL